MRAHMLWVLLGLVVVIAEAVAQPPETFGCEPNPTGNPVGGGEGYTDIRTTGSTTVRTAEELVAALGSAEAGDVIFIPDGVEIDLSAQERLRLPGGVTLAGTRGLNGSQGARLFSTRKIGTQFATAGDGVRITGLRFEGPSDSTQRVAENACFLITEHQGLEVDNCEIYRWNLQAIQGVRGASELYIHHNFIHDCARSGAGYGVSVYQCDARIIGNNFDHCRHCIASSGDPGCSYEAAYNLVLPHHTSHHFDMHGGADRGDGTVIGGEWIHIHHNTFMGDSSTPLALEQGDTEAGERRSVVLRGVPCQGAVIDHNWFARPTSETIWTFGYGNITIYRNVWGPDRILED